MPFVPSTCGVRIAQNGAFRAYQATCRRALPERLPLRRARCFPASLIYAQKAEKRKEPAKPEAAAEEKPTRRELINRLLASSKASLIVVGFACLNYVLVMAIIAHRIASTALPGHERILLTALAVLLPDFRYVLKTYLDAVSELKRYKPPSFPFANVKVSSSRPPPPAPAPAPSKADGTAASEQAYHFLLRDPSPNEMLSNLRLLVDAEIAKANSIISEKVSNVTRDMTRPLMETSTTIQQLTIGTDLTLRKNVLVAAITIFLSLLGYFASAAGEAGIGCVVVMIATLLPSAILAQRRHELLILINDSRVCLSLFGTLAAVLCAFLPLTAAYFFFGACIGLVAVRAPF